MTLKYESEILFDLMKRDGDVTPSDVLPYESELKEKYLKQVEGAYPKLMDYRAEWLNYNLEAYLPADFPVETLSNVTSATVDNVVPYEYRSAILKGNTLVNIVNYGESFVNTGGKYLQITSLVYSPIGKPITLINFSNKVITFQVTANGTFKKAVSINANSKTVITLSDGEEIKNIRGTQGNGWTIDETSLNELMLGLMVIAGDYTNVDIPYFTGMQSVKMPVLTTTGKNLFDKKNHGWNLEIGYVASNGEISDYYKHTIYTQILDVPKNIQIISVASNLRPIITYYDKNDVVLNQTSDGIIDTSYERMRLSFRTVDNSEISEEILLNSNIQIEYGTVATSYEPYKSIILTVNEDVTLRGIGDVKDTLDCLTGKMTKRIDEVVLDGSENWKEYIAGGTTLRRFVCEDKILNAKSYNEMSNILPTNGDSWTKDITSLSIDGSKKIVIQFNSSDSRYNYSLDEFKQWLSQNPITVQYQLATESIKTVDLNIQDQDGNTLIKIKPIEGTMHIHSDGTPVKPTITMEIPVEAITQNLASFIKEE